MKKTRRIIIATILLLCISMKAFAADYNWNAMPGHHHESILLDDNISSSKDTYRNNARGEILSEGSVEIANKRNGTIYISIDTSAHRNVDCIFHTVFLDQWDDNLKAWRQVDYFEFEAVKDEKNNLNILINSFTVSGYPVNKYYRVRGLHGVELGDEMEGCATETHGVLITNN